MYRILVAEDEGNTNQVICEFLKEAGYYVTSVLDGESAEKCFFENNYDLVILDIMMPKVNGIDVLKEIRRLSNVPVMILTALEDEYTQLKSFNAQADEYVTKPFSPLVLVKRVQTLLRRSNPIDKTVVNFENISVDFSSYKVIINGKKVALTTREIEILKVLIENQGIALSRGQILDYVWGFNSEPSDRIIDTHIKNLRHKLGCQAIKTVKGIGYKFEV